MAVPGDLYMSKFKTPQLLDKFLTTLFEPNANASVTDRVNRLKSSIAYITTYSSKIIVVKKAAT